MKKGLFKKILSIILSIAVFMGTININAFANEDGRNAEVYREINNSLDWDGNTKEYSYEGENYDIVFKLKDYWDEGYNVSVIIKNTSNEVINNWYLAYNKNYLIKNIWNAEITDDGDKFCIIKNAEWNQDILPGQTAAKVTHIPIGGGY